jgi:hypothetical protein
MDFIVDHDFGRAKAVAGFAALSLIGHYAPPLHHPRLVLADAGGGVRLLTNHSPPRYNHSFPPRGEPKRSWRAFSSLRDYRPLLFKRSLSMRFRSRFSVRDLFLLGVIAVLAVGWSIDHSATSKTMKDCQSQLAAAKGQIISFQQQVNTIIGASASAQLRNAQARSEALVPAAGFQDSSDYLYADSRYGNNGDSRYRNIGIGRPLGAEESPADTN